MECVVSNVAIATALALVAALVGRVTAKPQVTHTLWLLVLVKLVTPPFVHIPVSFPFSEAVALESPADSAMNGVPDLASATKEEPPERAAKNEKGIALAEAPIPALMPNQEADVSYGDRSAPAVPWLNLLVGAWGTGSLIWFWLAGTRLWRFRKVLRYALPAVEGIQAEVSAIASKYGLRTIPGVFVAEAKIPPLIWGFCGQNSMVLPSDLLDGLGADERAGLLAHELAHLKRCDHWIRWFEFSVLGIYWWNPVAWWARSEVQQAEEKCCDAWVLWVFPDKARQYAQALVNTVDFLACSPERTPDIATTFCQGHSLKRRIEMIVNNKVSQRLSWKMRTVLALTALVVASVSVLAQGGDRSETGGSLLPDMKAKKNLGRMATPLS
jgi:beta-lactamase regulating signal transducer with metallopeptidase domain